MTGTLINVGAILLGTGLGLLFKKGLPEMCIRDRCVRARPVPARTGRGESALSREKTRLFWRKLACLLPAVPLMALGISCNITADLGSDPYTSFQQGLAGLTGLRVGTVSVLVNVAIAISSDILRA